MSDLVRMMRLPRTFKRRAATKGVLLTLADKCDDDGTNAFPRVPTIAAEADIGVRTADKCLQQLREARLIAEQAPPHQHFPRRWQLELKNICAHIDPRELEKRLLREVLQGRNFDGQGRSFDVQGRKNGASGSQHVADQLLNSINGGTVRASARPHPVKASLSPPPSPQRSTSEPTDRHRANAALPRRR